MWLHFLLSLAIFPSAQCAAADTRPSKPKSHGALRAPRDPLDSSSSHNPEFGTYPSLWNEIIDQIPVVSDLSQEHPRIVRDLQERSNFTSEDRRVQRRKLKDLKRKFPSNLPNYLQNNKDYEEDVLMPLVEIVDSFNSLKEQIEKDNSSQLIITKAKEFVQKCDMTLDIADFLSEFKGWHCADVKFSPSVATNIFEFIDKFTFSHYWLSEDEQKLFGVHFAALYFQWERNGPYSVGFRNIFIEQKGSVFKNKLYLLVELFDFLSIDYRRAEMSDCTLLTAFVMSQFNRSALLEGRDHIVNHVHHFRNFSQMCARFSNSKNPEKGEKLILEIEEKIAYVYPVLTEWFDSLLESTWPKTEIEIVRGIMKESARGLQIRGNSAEYERIANVVHNDMASIGSPKYLRQFVITRDYMERHPSFNHESQCKSNNCAQGSAMGAQCTILRIPNNETEMKENLKKLESFAKNITETVVDSMETKYKDEAFVSKVVDQLSSNEGIDLRQFVNHSSFIAMRHSKTWQKCKVSYGIKADEALEPSALHIVAYHDNGGWFSRCHDWVFFLGV